VPGETNADGALEPMEIDDLQQDFENSFEKCRMPGTSDPFVAAAKLGDAHPSGRPTDHNSRGYPRFLSMCAFLPYVLHAPESGFFLPCRKPGPALGVKRPNTVSSWIALATRDGYLHRTTRHSFSARKAAEFKISKMLQGWAAQWVD